MGVVSVSFLVDGTQVASDSSSPYSVVLDTRVLSNGSHSLTVRAIDAAGNATTSAARTVTVSNSAPNLLTGLAAYWSFDDGTGQPVEDKSPNRNDGAVQNGVSATTGKFKSALLFDGADDFVRVPSSASLNLSDAVTVSAWVTPEVDGAWQSIVRKVVEEGTHVFPFTSYDMLLVDGGNGTFQPRISVSGTDGSRVTATGSSLAYGGTYNIIGTYDRATLRIFVNGTEQGSATYTSPLIQTAGPLLIGRHGAGGDFFKGKLDDLRIYSRALVASEIQSLYSAVPPSAPVAPVLQ
jgi:hypothetical protein